MDITELKEAIQEYEMDIARFEEECDKLKEIKEKIEKKNPLITETIDDLQKLVRDLKKSYEKSPETKLESMFFLDEDDGDGYPIPDFSIEKEIEEKLQKIGVHTHIKHHLLLPQLKNCCFHLRSMLGEKIWNQIEKKQETQEKQIKIEKKAIERLIENNESERDKKNTALRELEEEMADKYNKITLEQLIDFFKFTCQKIENGELSNKDISHKSMIRSLVDRNFIDTEWFVNLYDVVYESECEYCGW